MAGPPGADRRQAPAVRQAVVMVDIDYFKWVNDHHGHAAGDALLSAFAGVLRNQCREGDLAVRWGGEEFLLCFGVADESQAMQRAEALRGAVAATRFDIGEGRSESRTCSVGVACLPFDASQPELLDWQHVVDLADHALYLAKRAGRNRVVGLMPAAPLPDNLRQRLVEGGDGLLKAGLLRELHPPG